MKIGTIVKLIACIYLTGMISVSAITQTDGGIDISAKNGGFASGILNPGTTSISIGDTDFIRDIGADEVQGFSALFANDDNTLGTVTARRASWWPWGGSTSGSTTVKDPAKSYALLTFQAPTSPINWQLIQSGRPSSTTKDQFTKAVEKAAATWNSNGVVTRTFYGTVDDAPAGTTAQNINDNIFVQSFKYSSDSWLAATYFSSKQFYSTESITDADTIYNSRYSYSVDPLKTQKTYLRYVDLQAVALHEMGHPIGLDDIYNKADKKWDTTEVMNSYIWGKPRYSLGVGDKAGLKAKYG